MVSFEMNDRKKIGLGLTGFGLLFSFLGIIMLFDKGFLAMGNILFVSGVLLTIGLKPTMQFFTKPKNHKGSISFGIGFLLVLIGWPALGMMVESYGFIMLFRLWLLANRCSLPAKEPRLRLDIPSSFCDLADHTVQRKASPGVIRLAAGSFPKHAASPVQK
ncbi:hypothetical protein ACP70R_004674 [Stipagrostis hirtigluma subsp. patula]